MSHASTLSLSDFRRSQAPEAELRPSRLQRFLDALDRLSLDGAPSKASVAYAHAFRTKPIPSAR